MTEQHDVEADPIEETEAVYVEGYPRRFSILQCLHVLITLLLLLAVVALGLQIRQFQHTGIAAIDALREEIVALRAQRELGRGGDSGVADSAIAMALERDRARNRNVADTIADILDEPTKDADPTPVLDPTPDPPPPVTQPAPAERSENEPQRVTREHATETSPAFAPLAQRLDFGAPDEETITAEQARADLDELEWHLEDRFSYLTMRGVDYRLALDTIRASLDDTISLNAFAWQLQRFICLFGDGHAGVRQFESLMPREYAWYLVGDAGGRLVAYKPDRSGLIDEDHPYLVSIDGLPVNEWLDTAAQLVPAGSRQSVQRNATRMLRHIALLRMMMGREASPGVEIELESEDRRRTVQTGGPVLRRKPIYGAWPRTTSRLLDGNIGYVRLPRMNSDAAQHVTSMMTEFAETDGLIIDVRGNTGGSRQALLALMPHLMRDDDPPYVANVAAYRLSDAFDRDHLAVRYMTTPDEASVTDAQRAAIESTAGAFTPHWTLPEGSFSDWHYLVLDRQDGFDAPTYDRPVIVLTDEDCFSATDIFLGALSGWRNVTLLGRPSGGGSGRTTSVELTHSGLELRLSSMASFRADGTPYDGVGVMPDVIAERMPSDFVGGSDTQLDAALALFESLATQP